MIDLQLPEPLMWALRWLLLLGPIGLFLALAKARAPDPRSRIACLFSFLYAVSTVFVAHVLAVRLGWWRYGWDALMLEGIPMDLLIGGSMLFGPVLHLAFPKVPPPLIVLPIVLALHGTIFKSLRPLVEAGPGWFFGVVFVFSLVHIPSMYLARWTQADVRLPLRAGLLAVMFAALAFGVLPSLIMQAMGGDWALAEKPLWAWAGLGAGLAFSFAIGLAAAQMLAVQGLGTAIPLDPTKRLVRTGIYAFVCNPMQLSAALSWVILGLFLGNVWVMSAAIMAWVFVEGMVRWHHRHDLEARFPEGWTDYRRHVPEWRPRWRPWTPQTAVLTLERGRPLNALVLRLLKSLGAQGLEIREGAGPPLYANPLDVRPYEGFPALCAALGHGNFLSALFGQMLSIPAMALAAARRREPADEPAA